MHLSMIILAASESDYAKIAFGIIFFLIWIASAATGVIAKRQQQQRRREMESGMQRVPHAAREAPRRAATNAPAARSQRRGQTKKRSSVVPTAVQPPPLIPRSADLIAGTAPVTATEISSTSEQSANVRPAPASPAALRSWMKPATLRQQFILTEIFQPPLSMRDRSE
jgi:hypothetical protein